MAVTPRSTTTPSRSLIAAVMASLLCQRLGRCYSDIALICYCCVWCACVLCVLIPRGCSLEYFSHLFVSLEKELEGLRLQVQRAKDAVEVANKVRDSEMEKAKEFRAAFTSLEVMAFSLLCLCADDAVLS